MTVLRSTFYVLRSTFYVLRSTFYVLRSTFYVLRSTFYVLLLAGCSGYSFESNDFGASSLLPCTEGIATSDCYTPAGNASSSSLGTNVTTWSNASGSTTVTGQLPKGYYSDRTISFSDPNLLAGNIASGVTIFGVSGSASGIPPGCGTPGLQVSNCTASSSTYWTNVTGSNLTGSNGQLAITVPSGYYDGSTTSTAADSALLASNIRQGASIFGVTGSLVPAYANCSTSGLQVSSCTANSSTYWTNVTGSNLTGSNGQLAITIPSGYYDGSTTSTATDSALLASNIRQGASIFGVTGSLVPAYAPCTDDAMNTSACSTSPNRYVTSIQGSSITLAGSTSATITTGYHSGATQCSVNDPALAPSNIKSGFTILGVAGTYVGATAIAQLMASTMSKDSNTSAMSSEQETTTYAGKTQTSPGFPTNYRMIPDMSKDDEGVPGSTVILVDRSTWGATTCGLTQSTVDARITDCENILGVSTTSWDGALKGNAGYGVWKLVSRSGAMINSAGSYMGKEIWQDQRTKLLWSSYVGRAANYCLASGVHNIAGTVGSQPDPLGYCDGVSAACAGSQYCQSTTGNAASFCYEGTGFVFPSPNQFGMAGATFLNLLGKSGLGLSSTPSIAWRLPTLADVKVADANGMRFVMPDALDTVAKYEWTATTRSTNHYGYMFSPSEGGIQIISRNSGGFVRCVGH